MALERKVEESEDKDLGTPNYTKDEQKNIEFLDDRFQELEQARQSVGPRNINIETIWTEADLAYEPHSFKLDGSKGRRVFAQADVGARSKMITLGQDGQGWRTNVSQPNAYIQIQTALSILVDQNPEAVFLPNSSRFEATTMIQKSLYQSSWEMAKSKSVLRNFIFNQAKYGFAVGRTYPRRDVRTVKDLVEFDPSKPEEAVYEERIKEDFNGVYRENLNPKNVWIDDMAVPNDPLSARDWRWRQRYSKQRFDKEFGEYKYAKFVPSTAPKVDESQPSHTKKRYQEKGSIIIDFYENKELDLYSVKANGIWTIPGVPLPTLHKQLSGWWAPWTLRDDQSIYGIGIYEAIRNDQQLIDRIRNMRIDQIVLMIYGFWLYSGVNQFDDDGKIIVQPGVGKQVPNVDNIKEMKFSGPGKESADELKQLQEDMQNASGVNRPLQGQESGKTAFEVSILRNAALRRLAIPVAHIVDALEIDARLTVELNEQIFSVTEVTQIVEPSQIERFKQEVQNDPDLFQEEVDEETGETKFMAKVPREIPMNLDFDDKGRLIESENQRFFRVRPSALKWEGMIRIKPQSIVTKSQELEKQMTLELFGILNPIITAGVQIPDQALLQTYIDATIKPIKQILLAFEEDPDKWLPDRWLEEPDMKQQLFEPPLPIGPEGKQAFVTGKGSATPAPPAPKQGGLGATVKNMFKSVAEPFRR